jgi:uncharacterized glyoxalase superfamily protein PhnB
MTTTATSYLQATSLVPSLTVDDLQQSITFYEKLGFIVEERWEDEGVLRGVMLQAGEFRIGLAQDDWQKGRDRRKGVGLRIYVGTRQDIEAVAARAKASGVTLETDVHDTPWGSRAFELTDPTGFKLTLASEP